MGLWQWIEAHGGWQMLVTLPFALVGGLIAVVMLLGTTYLVFIQLPAVLLFRIDPGDVLSDWLGERAQRRNDERMRRFYANVHRTLTERELEQMRADGQIVWVPAPVIESTKPGFRETDV